MNSFSLITFRVSLCLIFCGLISSSSAQQPDSLRFPDEHHLRNIRQITFGGENAEAYFSFNGDRLSFQSTRDSLKCDQIFTMDLAGQNVHMLSTGYGRTTCSYYLPGDSTIIYASTHLADSACPPRPDYSQGYVWAVYSTYDIFLATTKGKIIRQLTSTAGYDAEATVSPVGNRIVFTSVRNGDLDLYSMNLDGSDVKQLTTEIGYDGGAFYSSDGKQIVYRADHPTDPKAIQSYQELLKNGLVRPTKMDLFIMNADGSNKRQITHFGAASFAPFFHPDGKHIIFASNMNDPKGRNFDLYFVDTDGKHLEQITFNETFDGFPMFSRDGKKLVFASNRFDKIKGETNIFIADWVP
jgi:Tol biopolymer transport system component